MIEFPAIFIIVGASGDLSKRYLLPALSEMKSKGMLPKKFRIVGTSRNKNMDVAELFRNAKNAKNILPYFEIGRLDANDQKTYREFKRHLSKIEKSLGKNTRKIFLLSIPTWSSGKIIKVLGNTGILKNKDKLLFEKPFGKDFKSAKALLSHAEKWLGKNSLWLVDHYMAKKSVQKMLEFRKKSKRDWSKNSIESIEVVASEKIGIEGRVDFYEQTGALRDYMQSHLLRILSMVIMDMPKNSKVIPGKRLQALKNLYIDKNKMKRGQYRGYREEVQNPKSIVETFASIELSSKNPKWVGVKMKLATGKALAERDTHIKIKMKDGKEIIFKEDFSKPKNAHTKILRHAMESNNSLFSSFEETLQSWKIIDPVSRAWQKSDKNLFFYKKGNRIEKLSP